MQDRVNVFQSPQRSTTKVEIGHLGGSQAYIVRRVYYSFPEIKTSRSLQNQKVLDSATVVLGSSKIKYQNFDLTHRLFGGRFVIVPNISQFCREQLRNYFSQSFGRKL